MEEYFNKPETCSGKVKKVSYYVKPASVRDLENEYWEYRKRKVENFPAEYVPKMSFRDDTANGLTHCICKWGEMHPMAYASRVNTTGIYDVKLKRYRTTGATKGFADIDLTFQGRSIKIEVKIGKDRQSDKQKKFMENTINAGGIYWIVKSFDDFLSKISTI